MRTHDLEHWTKCIVLRIFMIVSVLPSLLLAQQQVVIRAVEDRALIRVASTNEAYFVFVVSTNLLDLVDRPMESTVIPRRGSVTDYFFINTNATARAFFFALRSNLNCDPIDNDGDGIDDVIEALIPFLDPNNPLDAGIDHDGDGWDTRTEIYLGTNPHDPDDAFGPLDRTRFAPVAGSVVFDGGFVLSVIDDMNSPLQATGGGRVGAVWAALNADPYPDLLAIDPFSDELQVYLGQADGTLSLAYTLPSGGAGPLAVDARHVIGDGAVDVLVGHSDGTVTFFEGDGDGGLTFRPDLTLTDLGTIVSLTAEDLNGDGDVDILVSGGDRVTLLVNAQDPVPSNPVINGNFTDGLRGWTPLPNGGRVSVQGGRAVFEEQQAFLTGIEQTFHLPANPETLTVDIVDSQLASLSGSLPDIFEILLTDGPGNPLLAPFRADAETLFNRGPGGDRLGANTTHQAQTVRLDLTSLEGNHPARLIFTLIGSPGPDSLVAIDHVSVQPNAVFAETFTAVSLPGSFIQSGGVVTTDRQGNGLPDILVEDAGLGLLILFENQGNGEFVRNELQPFDYGCPPVLPWEFDLGNPVSDAKYFVADALTWQVHPYLMDGTPLSPVTPMAGTAIRSLETHPDGSRSWLVHSGDPRIYVYDAQFQSVGTWTPDGISNVVDIAAAGTDLWVLGAHLVFLGGDPEDLANYATEYRMSQFENGYGLIEGTWTPDAQWALPDSMGTPRHLVSDGLELRVLDINTRRVHALDFEGASLGEWTLATENESPRGLARSGTDLFVADREERVVYKYAGAMNRTGGIGTAEIAFALSPTNLEPVDISDPATSIGLDTAVEGEFVTGDELLEYVFDITAPVTVVVESIDIQGPNWNFDPEYTLTDPNGNPVNNWAYLLQWDRNAMTLTQAGTYTLAFRSWGETGTMSFSVRSLIPTSTQSLEPGVLTSNTLASPGDVHRYTFSAAHPVALLLSPGDGDFELAWRIVDADDNALMYDNFWGWESFRLPFPAGAYALEVWHLPDGTGEYSFTLSVLELGTATPIELDTVYTNTFDSVPEVHVYALNITDSVVFLADAISNDSSVRWVLIGPDGRTDFDNTFVVSGPRFLNEPGEYTLYVYAQEDVDEYSFSFREYTRTTQPVAFGETTTGTVAPAEALVYEFELTESAILNFTRLGNFQAGLQWEAIAPGGTRLFPLASWQNQGPFPAEQTGTYSLVVYSRNAFAGSASIRVDAFPYQETVPVTAIDFNTPVEGTIGGAFWEAHYTIELEQPTTFGFNRLSGINSNLMYRLIDPEGTQLFSTSSTRPPRLYEVTGTYTLIVYSINANVPGSYSFELRLPEPVSVEEVFLDTVVSSEIEEAFQERTYEIHIEAGSRIQPESQAGLDGSSFLWSMRDPSNNSLFSSSMTTFLVVPAFTAPETGIYQVTVSGVGSHTGTTAFILYTVPDDPAPVPLVLNEIYAPEVTPDQTHTFRFDVIESVSVFYNRTRPLNTEIMTRVRLIDPDGETVFGPQTDQDLGPFELTKSGTYSLELSGVSGKGEFHFQLWEVPQHDPVPLSLADLATSVITAPGERRTFSFDGAAGDRIYLEALIRDNRFSARLFDPEGNTLRTQVMNGDMNTVELPADGTYRIEVFFSGSSLADFDGITGFRFWNVHTADAIPLRIGDVIAGSIGGPRGRAAYTFEGETGDRYFFDRQSLGMLLQGNNSYDWRLIAPSSDIVFSSNWVNGGVVELPETGLYTLEIEGRHNQAARTFQFQIWPWNPPEPVEIALGAAVSGAISAPGVTNIYRFEASAGDPVVVDVVSMVSPIRYRLVDPNGNTIAGPSSGNLNPGPLPVSGDYEVHVTENYGSLNDRFNRYAFLLDHGPLPLPQPPVADLRAESVETPGVIVANPAQLEVTWTVTNAGAAATGASDWVDRIVLSADRTVYGSGDEWYFDVPHVGNLTPGASYTRSHVLDLPPDFEGEFNVFVIADANNAELERNESNNVGPGKLTSVYREPRPMDDSPAILLDFANGARFPQGEQILISGTAKAIAASENVILILDASGSAFFDEGFDANGDGVFDIRDDINHDGWVGSGWDVQLVAMEALAKALQDTGTDLRISPIIWGMEQFVLDSGPAFFRQTFIHPDQDANGNNRPDFLEAMDMVRYVSVSALLTRLYIEGFTGYDMAPGNDLEQGVLGAIERIQQAQEVGRTRVILLVDAGPATAGDANSATIAALASYGISFEVFQIVDPEPMAPESQVFADLIDADPASSGRATVMERTEDLVRAIVETLSVAGVTVNGMGAESVDSSGRFFTPYVVQPGEQTITVTAYDTRGVAVSREFTLIGYDAHDTDEILMADFGETLEPVYSGMTFRPSDNVLVADVAVLNRSGFPQRGPFEMRVLEVIPSTALILYPDRIDPDGVPVFHLDPLGVDLAPNATGAVTQISIANPMRERITLRTEILGRGNRAPRFTSAPPSSVTVNNLWRYEIGVVDDDGDPIELALIEHPATMTLEGNHLNWTPVPGDAGHHGVRLRTHDDRGGRTEQVFQILVEEDMPNRTPIFFSVPITTLASGDDYRYVPDVRDPDGDTLTFQLTNPPSGFAVNAVNGTVTYPAIPDGVYALELQADDGNGGVAVQRFDLSVGVAPQNSFAPMILTTPPTIAVVGHTYQYFPSAYDPDGDPLTFSLPTAPTGMEIDPATGRISWVSTPEQMGAHSVLLRAEDPGGLFASQFFTVTVQATALNRTPLITGFPPGFATEDVLYETTIEAEDPDVDLLTFALEMGPEGMSIHPVTGLVTWLAPVGSIGLHTARVAVSDPHEATAHLTWFIDVRASNTPPVFASSPPTTIPAGVTYRYTAQALDAEDAVSYLLMEGPNGMTLDPALGVVRWATRLSDIGTVPVRIAAVDDRGLTAEQSFQLRVEADTTPPEVTVSLSSPYVNPGEPTTVRVTARDEVGVVSLGLLVEGVDLPIDGNGLAEIVPTTPGLLAIEGYAVDAEGNRGVHEVVLRVFDPNDTQPPDIVITSPTSQADLAMYFAVEGEIIDPEDNLDYYTIDIARADAFNHVQPFVLDLNCDGCFTELMRVHTASASGTLGHIDPTLYLNGDYVVRVTAFDINGQGRSEGVVVSFDGVAKPGAFTLDTIDLYLDTPGIPVEVVRRYESLRRDQSGDFGFGWSLIGADPDIRTTVRNDRLPFSGFHLYPMYVGSRVYLTDPDGHRVGFTFDAPFDQASLIGATYRPEFVPDPGVFDALSDPMGTVPLSLRNGGETFLFLVPLPYNPDQYQLTRRDGTRYLYDKTGGLLQVTDRSGNEVSYSNEEIRHSNGTVIRMERDALGRITRVRDPESREILYTYDEAGRLVAFTDRLGRTTRYRYSEEHAHLLMDIIDANGVVRQQAEFDQFGRVTTLTDALGQQETYSYDSAAFRGTRIDANGFVTELEYDERALLIRETDPLGHVTGYEYDEYRNRVAEVDAMGRTNRYVYSATGERLAHTNPLGHVTTYDYDAFGNQTARTNALGHVEFRAYDDDGNVTEIVNEAGETQQIGYDNSGRLTAFVDALGHTVAFEYGSFSTFTRVLAPEGGSLTLEYDALAQLKSEQDETGWQMTYVRDAQGNIVKEINGRGHETTHEYDVADRIIRTIHADGASREFVYDAADRLIREVDENGGVTEYGYDGNGNRVSVTDPLGNTTRFVYDAMNRLVSRIDALGNASTHSYDAVGNRIESVDRNGRRRTFEYDAANRVTHEHWHGTDDIVRTIEYTYDALDNVVSITDPDTAYTYTYDAANRLTHFSVAGTPVYPDVSVTLERDGAGRVTSIRDSDGVETVWSHDGLNRPVDVSWTGYDAVGSRVEWDMTACPCEQPEQIRRFASATAMEPVILSTIARNPVGGVTSLTHRTAAGTSLVEMEWTRDAREQPLTRSLDGVEHMYTHDALGQLMEARTAEGSVESYNYDGMGNRTDPDYSVTTGNRLVGAPDLELKYDAEGNVIEVSFLNVSATATLEWDHRNRLIAWTLRDTAQTVIESIQYTYDAWDQRIAVTRNGVTEATLWNVDRNPWAQYDADGNVTQRYLYGTQMDQVLAAWNAAEGLMWYLTDTVNTVHAVVDATGGVLNRNALDSFGVILDQTNPGARDALVFTGRDHDATTGLVHMRARDYWPELGRFLSEDPMDFEAEDLNLYRYVFNNPLLFFDPTGMMAANEYKMKTSSSLMTRPYLREVGQCIVLTMALITLHMAPPNHPGMGQIPNNIRDRTTMCVKR